MKCVSSVWLGGRELWRGARRWQNRPQRECSKQHSHQQYIATIEITRNVIKAAWHAKCCSKLAGVGRWCWSFMSGNCVEAVKGQASIPEVRMQITQVQLHTMYRLIARETWE